MKTTKIIGTLCAVTLMVTLAIGCESSGETAPTAKATTTTVGKLTPTDVFVNSMRTQFPNASRSDLIDIGQASCDVIDAFGSVAEAMIAIAIDPTWDSEMAGNAGYTFGAAVPVFCPEYEAEIKALVG